MAFDPKPKNPFVQPKSSGFNDTQGQSRVGGSAGQGQSVIGSGGSSGRARAAADAAARAQAEAVKAQILAEANARQKAAEDALRIKQEQAKLEQQRIENLRRAILQKGAQEQQRILRNELNQRIRITTTEINRIDKGKSTNSSVWKYENLDTGEVRYRSYEKPTGGGGRVLSGGVDGFQQVATNGQSSKKQRATFEPFERVKGGVASEALGLGRLSNAINQYRNSVRVKASVGKLSQGQQTKLLASGFVAGIADAVIGVVDLPQTLYYLARNPSEIRNIPGNIAKAGENFGYILTLNPGEGLAYIGGSLVGIKGTNSAIRTLANAKTQVITRLNPKFVGSGTVGKTLKIKVGGGRSVNVKVVAKMPKQTLAQQINLAGKKVNAISSQADDMFRILSKKRVVRKPIPGEAKFNVATKNLLKKFDSGKISRTELTKLDDLIKKQGAKGLLERTFFADPSGKIRPSRLGITQDTSGLLDYLSGDVTFRKAKPQIFLFNDIQVSRYPKALQGIANKIKMGKSVTKGEWNKILAWDVKPTGRFKPLGFISGESEIILAPGEILRKVKKIGVTIVKGRKVPIYKVEVFRPTGLTKNLLNKLGTGRISNVERLKLKRLLQRQTGRNYASSYTPNARYVNVRYVGYNSLGRLSTRLSRTGSSSRVLRGSVSRFSGSRTSGRSRSSGSSRGSSSGSSRGSSRRSGSSSGISRGSSSRRSSGSSSGRSFSRSRFKSSKPISSFKIPKGFSSRRLSKSVKTYYVVEKVRGKYRKLYPKPLTAKDARDYATYSIDNRLSKTAFFIPLGKAKSVVRPPKNIQGYYSKNSRKFRPYRIKYGKRRQLVNGFIEKRKYFQDTRGERLQARNLRSRSSRPMNAARRKQLILQLQKARAVRMRQMGRSARPMRRSRPVRRVQRRINPAQRRELLRRLAKARKVRMMNLRRRR
jgi:hypothetical protein